MIHPNARSEENQASSTFPTSVQIEISALCNLACPMCIYSEKNHQSSPSNNLSAGLMPITLYEKIAEDLFPHVNRVILFGVGEPLMHPAFDQILEITTQWLPHGGKVEFTTNGTLLNQYHVDLLKHFPIYRVILSLDTPCVEKLANIRPGIPPTVMNHLHLLQELRDQNAIEKIAISTVIMKENLHDLPFLLQMANKYHIDQVFFTHLLPYSLDFAEKTLLQTCSKSAWEVMESMLQKGWNALDLAIANRLHPAVVHNIMDAMTQNAIAHVNSTYQKGTLLNINRTLPLWREMAYFSDAQRIFHELTIRAKEFGIQISLPPLFVNPQTRICPYISQNTAMIRVDGMVVPCFNYLYSHHSYINHHEKQEFGQPQGSLTTNTFSDIWNSPSFSHMRQILTNLEKNVPWCGDCPYSSYNCYFIKSNECDCVGNHPGCQECVFSTGMVRCLFD